MTESDLIIGCKNNDPKSQEQLYNRYAPKMLSVCRRYVSDLSIAQDLLQEGFIKVFSKICTYSGEGLFAGWMRRVFVTTSLEYLRKNDVLKDSTTIDENSADEINPSVLSTLTTADLLHCIDRLPVGYRTVFNLYVMEGYSHAEIDTQLQIQEKTSQSQLVRARKLLQKDVLTIIGQDYGQTR
jgi:RNA polymerase sigma-70 factor (ECF subfamily)